ncbi:DUF1471 domain-containing protein [Klebsiella aerogenes]|uniref:DUF1471 domain-containing protein n=1 Tax=Klebsiella aerogenes TaxID=548 RepID=UPI0037A288A8
MYKYLLSAFFLMISTGAFAAKEIRHSEMAGMTKEAGTVNVDVRDGTIDEAIKAISKKADEKGAKYFRITSIGMDGMGSNVSAAAVIYK